MSKLTSGMFMLFMVLPGTFAWSQDSAEKTIAQRLNEVQSMIDEEIRTIATLEEQLNRAVDGKEAGQIDRIRGEIQSAWQRVEKLKELKASLKELADEFKGTSNPVRPHRTDEFNRDPSSMKPRNRATGYALDDGTTIDTEFGRDTSSAKPPKPQRGDIRDDGDPNGRTRTSTKPARPVRGVGGGGRAPEGDAPNSKSGNKNNSSERLEALRRSHAELIAAGEFDMAATVMDLIQKEKKRLSDANKDESRPAQGGGAAGDRSAGPPAARQPAEPGQRAGDDKELQELVQSMKDELKTLREEVRKLRQQQRDKENGDQ
jgi:protein-arginine kinase activator protein McsA